MALMLGFTTLVSAFASSIFSTATQVVAASFGVSTEVGVLGLSLYVLGFATGPILWAPLSELKGRRLPLIGAMFGFSIFSVATATAKDLQTVMLTRFFAGVFGSCPLAVVAAIFSDMFDNKTRGLAITVFSMTVFTGPLLAPFIGGFILMNPSLGWRWTEYIVAIMGFLAFGLNLIFLEETYPPIVLVQKAATLRRRTLNWGIHAKQEEIEVDFRELVTKNFSRPLRLLVTEPIVLLLSIYMGFIYGLLYLFLTAYPIVFQQIRGFSPGVGGLPYFGMILGQLTAGVYIASTQPAYNRKLAANGGVPIPEWRLFPVILGGISFTGGLFWFGWSGYQASTHWIVPTLSGILTGFGLLAIFLPSLNYLVDAYLMLYVANFSSSPLSINKKTNPENPHPTNYHSQQRRLRHRRKHLPPLHRRRRLPPLRLVHVRRPGRQLGQLAPRLRRPRPRPHPRRLLQVRRAHPGAERLRAHLAEEYRPAGREWWWWCWCFERRRGQWE